MTRRYNRLSIAAKQAAVQNAMREPGVACPRCGTQTAVADLLGHQVRCQGHSEPHPRSRWVALPQVRELGIPPSTLTGWVQRGLVRFRGQRLDRQYLYRDLVLRLVDRRASVQQPRNYGMSQSRRKGWFRR